MRVITSALCFSCFYFTCGFSQVKYEKEYRIKENKVPENIKSYLSEISFKNRLKEAFKDLNNIDTLSIK